VIGILVAATLSITPSESPRTEVDIDMRAENASALLAQAEGEYRAGLEARMNSNNARPHFRSAAAAYERLWQLGYRNPTLARNLAQAHLLAGDLARAIRAYHLGQRIAAHDADLRAGLAYAREQVHYPLTGNLSNEARYHDRNSLLRYGPAWFFGALAFAIYLVAFLLLARGWMSRRPVWFTLGGVLITVSILVGGAVLWEDKHLADENALPLVVVAGDGAALHRGNGAEFPLRIAERLPEGVELIVLVERGGWFQVHLAGGTIGWVDARQVIPVERSSLP
jgi:tetratricopeptide (TPR) repeat protein